MEKCKRPLHFLQGYDWICFHLILSYRFYWFALDILLGFLWMKAASGFSGILDYALYYYPLFESFAHLSACHGFFWCLWKSIELPICISMIHVLPLRRHKRCFGLEPNSCSKLKFYSRNKFFNLIEHALPIS